MSEPGTTMDPPEMRGQLGRWSMSLAAVSAVLLIVGAAAARSTLGGAQSGAEPTAAGIILTAAGLYVGFAFALVGAALGLIGIVRGRSDRNVAILGTVLNVAIMLWGHWLAGLIIGSAGAAA